MLYRKPDNKHYKLKQTTFYGFHMNNYQYQIIKVILYKHTPWYQVIYSKAAYAISFFLRNLITGWINNYLKNMLYTNPLIPIFWFVAIHGFRGLDPFASCVKCICLPKHRDPNSLKENNVNIETKLIEYWFPYENST